ncbi:MAG TPA: hypothetical protein VJ813_16600 [Vicinamibacterales bacterium]|nr:hypothetical protein [Vicinamibacterales bacterium]
MMTGLAVVAAAAICGAAAGYALWWAAHRSALWNFLAAILLGLATFAAALGIGYLMMRLRGPL